MYMSLTSNGHICKIHITFINTVNYSFATQNARYPTFSPCGARARDRAKPSRSVNPSLPRSQIIRSKVFRWVSGEAPPPPLQPSSFDARPRDLSGVPALNAGTERRRCVSILDVGMTIPITNSRPARVTVRGAPLPPSPPSPHRPFARSPTPKRRREPGYKGGSGLAHKFAGARRRGMPLSLPAHPAARLAVRMSTHASEGVSKRTEIE